LRLPTGATARVRPYKLRRYEQADVVFLAAATPANPDGSPDLTYVRCVAQSVGERLGDRFPVIVNKSTAPIGSGNRVGSLLSDAYETSNGQKPKGNFAVASNPEFLREGAAVHDSLYPDRIVVGATQARAIDVLANLYRPTVSLAHA